MHCCVPKLECAKKVARKEVGKVKRILLLLWVCLAGAPAIAAQEEIIRETVEFAAYCPRVDVVHSCECIQANAYEAFKDSTMSRPDLENAMLDYVNKTPFNECFDDERARLQVAASCRSMNSQKLPGYCECFAEVAVAQWSRDARLTMSPFIHSDAFDACSSLN